mmetsp:Transcript_9198/g.37607  ORF Transcript_9198/g.37607 Transcript_9198/m.37607 type:complete len:358 (+) Transcript_9198:1596-2669(+)
MSSRDSRRSERAGAFGLFLGSSRAPAASSPSSSSEPEPESEPESESDSDSESDSSSMASPSPSSAALTSPSVLTVFTCANFSLFSFASASVKPSPSSPRASLRSSVLAPSSSSSSSSSEASSPSSLSSFFDLTALSASLSSSPPAAAVAPRSALSAFDTSILPALAPARRSSDLIRPYSRFAKSLLNDLAIWANETLPSSSSSSSPSSDNPSPSMTSALASSSSSSSPVFGPRSCMDTVYVRASTPVPECETPHGFSVTESFRASSARRTLRSRLARFSARSIVLACGSRGRVMTGVASFFAAAMRSSRRRGIPSVTLASPRPAKWKVLRVICVDGSPTDWPAMQPTASPGAASWWR